MPPPTLWLRGFRRPPLLEHLAESPGGFWSIALERPDVPLEERDRPQRRGRDDGGAPPAGGEDCDLADDVALADRADGRPVLLDVRGSLLDREQAVTEAPFVGERLAFVDLVLSGHGRNRLELLL